MSRRLMLLLALAPSAAMAHTGLHAGSSFMAGLSHPVGGLDHLLAMLAVGLWASRLGQKASWVPLGFSAGLLAGLLLANRFAMPGFVEMLVAASVLALGLLLATRQNWAWWVAMPLVGGFAVFHGWAHGAEMPGGAAPLGYATGMLLTSLGLHYAGFFAARPLQRHLQILGWGLGAIGAGLMFSV